MEGPARSCAQMCICGSFCTCCQWEAAKLVPIDNSAPPRICSSSDLQLNSKHSRGHGSPEVHTIDPEPPSSSLGSAFGLCRTLICSHLWSSFIDRKNKICIFGGSQRKRGGSGVHSRELQSGGAGLLQLSPKWSVIVFSLSWPFLLDLFSKSWPSWAVKRDKWAKSSYIVNHQILTSSAVAACFWVFLLS